MFEGLPFAQDLLRGLQRCVAEDVRVAAHQFVVQRLKDVLDGEAARLCRELRVKQDLQEDIAELLAQRVDVVSVNGLQHFVGLLEETVPKGTMVLLAVPRTALRAAQSRHEGHQV